MAWRKRSRCRRPNSGRRLQLMIRCVRRRGERRSSRRSRTRRERRHVLRPASLDRPPSRPRATTSASPGVQVRRHTRLADEDLQLPGHRGAGPGLLECIEEVRVGIDPERGAQGRQVDGTDGLEPLVFAVGAKRAGPGSEVLPVRPGCLWAAGRRPRRTGRTGCGPGSERRPRGPGRGRNSSGAANTSRRRNMARDGSVAISSRVMVWTTGLSPVKFVWISMRSMSLTIRSGGFSRCSQQFPRPW